MLFRAIVLVLGGVSTACFAWLTLIVVEAVPFQVSFRPKKQYLFYSNSICFNQTVSVSLKQYLFFSSLKNSRTIISSQVSFLQSWQLYVSVLAGGSILYSCEPLINEYTNEMMHPISEGIIGGFFAFGYNLVSSNLKYLKCHQYGTFYQPFWI